MRARIAVAILAVVGLTGVLRGQQATGGCEDAGGLRFICGPQAVEDLVEVPGTRWLIGSGYGEGGRRGRLHIIDSKPQPGRQPEWRALGAGDWGVALDRSTLSTCNTPPDGSFGAHGIALRSGRRGQHTLYVVNHAREAIEVFAVNARPRQPALSWTGCIKPPAGVYVNSVAVLPDGGLLATKFYDLNEGNVSIFQGKITGGVFEWYSSTGWRELPGTGLTGANGIEATADGRRVYVAAWGTEELVEFARDGSGRRAMKLGFWPDNLKWLRNGHLLVAGQVRAVAPDRRSAPPSGWRVVEIDPRTFQVTELLRDDGTSPLQNLSVAVEVGGDLWLGPFRGDRIGIAPIPRSR